MNDIKWDIKQTDVFWNMDWTRTKEQFKDEPEHRIHKKPDVEVMFEETDALAVLLINNQVFLNDHWWMKDEGWPEDACKVTSLNVNCNDVFCWGCADADEMNYSDIQDVYEHYIKDPYWGTAVWCIKKRNLMPQKPVYDSIMKDGIWDLDSMNLQPNPTWR